VAGGEAVSPDERAAALLREFDCDDYSALLRRLTAAFQAQRDEDELERNGLKRRCSLAEMSLRDIIGEIDEDEDDANGAIETARDMRIELDQLRRSWGRLCALARRALPSLHHQENDQEVCLYDCLVCNIEDALAGGTKDASEGL
jgi:hypothetical protein